MIARNENDQKLTSRIRDFLFRQRLNESVADRLHHVEVFLLKFVVAAFSVMLLVWVVFAVRNEEITPTVQVISRPLFLTLTAFLLSFVPGCWHASYSVFGLCIRATGPGAIVVAGYFFLPAYIETQIQDPTSVLIKSKYVDELQHSIELEPDRYLDHDRLESAVNQLKNEASQAEPRTDNQAIAKQVLNAKLKYYDGHYRDAIKSLGSVSVAQHTPRFVRIEFYRTLATSRIELHEYPEAIIVYHEMENDLGSLPILDLQNLAKCHYKQNNLDEASKIAARLVARNRAVASQGLQSELDLASALDLQANISSAKADELRSIGERAVAKSHYESAIASRTSAIRARREAGGLRLQIATMLHNRGIDKLHLSNLEKEIDEPIVASSDESTQLDEEVLDDFEESRNMFESVYQLVPAKSQSKRDIATQWGIALYTASFPIHQSGKSDLAIAMLRKASELLLAYSTSDNLNARYGAAAVLNAGIIELETGNPQTAIDVYLNPTIRELRRFLDKYDSPDLFRDLSIAYSRRAEAHEELGQYDQALRDYEQSLIVYPKSEFRGEIEMRIQEVQQELGTPS